MFLAHYAPNLAEIADEPPEVYESWKKAAEIVPPGDVLRAVDLLAEALVRLREGREERLMTELAFIKLTRPETATDPEALISRMDRLERRIGKPVEASAVSAAPAAPVASSATEPAPQPASQREDTAQDQSPEQESPAESQDALARAAAPLVSEDESGETEDQRPIDISFEQLQKVWPGLFGGLRDLLGARRWAFFREAVPAAVERNKIILEVAHDFHLSSLQQDDAVAPIVAAKASDLLGGSVKVEFRLKSDPAGADGGGDHEVDLDQLEERPSAETDPATLLESELGAKVVDD